MSKVFDFYARKILDANGGVASPKEVPLFHETTVRFIRVGHDDPQKIAIRLHNTDIVTLHDDGSIMLTTGGWKTATTKRKMNLAMVMAEAGIAVVSIRGQWYVNDLVEGTSTMFTEGINVGRMA